MVLQELCNTYTSVRHKVPGSREQQRLSLQNRRMRIKAHSANPTAVARLSLLMPRSPSPLSRSQLRLATQCTRVSTSALPLALTWAATSAPKGVQPCERLAQPHQRDRPTWQGKCGKLFATMAIRDMSSTAVEHAQDTTCSWRVLRSSCPSALPQGDTPRGIDTNTLHFAPPPLSRSPFHSCAAPPRTRAAGG